MSSLWIWSKVYIESGCYLLTPHPMEEILKWFCSNLNQFVWFQTLYLSLKCLGVGWGDEGVGVEGSQNFSMLSYRINFPHCSKDVNLDVKSNLDWIFFNVFVFLRCSHSGGEERLETSSAKKLTDIGTRRIFFTAWHFPESVREVFSRRSDSFSCRVSGTLYFKVIHIKFCKHH